MGTDRETFAFSILLRRLSEQPSDTLARIGGDEFVMILASQPQPEKASLIATRTIDALRRPFQIEGHRIEVGASIGISLYPEDGTEADALMRAADAAMYRVCQPVGIMAQHSAIVDLPM